MCNNLHPESQPIPREGEGWKVFEVDPKHPHQMLCWIETGPYTLDENGNPKWNEEINDWEDGFCFFTNLSDAQRTLQNFVKDLKWVLRKIRYQDGLGKHFELGFGEIALCKSFTLSKTAIRQGDHF